MKRAFYFLLLLIVIAAAIKIKNPVEIFETFAVWLYPEEPNRNAELMKILLTVLGGLGILYSLFLSYKRAKANDRSIQLQGMAISKQSEQLALSRKSQIDERFKNAVEHLGSDKEPIILGGVVELNQIARENPKDYAEVVFNILTSYIRSTTNIYTKKADDFNPTIIQTIIDYLLRGKESEDFPYDGLKCNLSHSNLKSVDLQEIDFTDADLSFCLFPMKLLGSNFCNSKLSKADFSVARIKNCDFSGADLHDTLFHLAEIDHCTFHSIEMYSTKFINSNISDCQFSHATLSNCHFLISILQRCDFTSCNI